MKPDFRALCAEIVHAADANPEDSESAGAAEGDFMAALDNARAALAAEQQGPTDEELADEYDRGFDLPRGASCNHANGLRAVLARWGAHRMPPTTP